MADVRSKCRGLLGAHVVEVSLKRKVCSRLKAAFPFLVALLILGGCNNRDNGADELDELPTAAPTATLIAELPVIPTFTPTAVPVIPSPTPTEIPTSVPTLTPAPNRTKTNVQANLRAGPGVVYHLVGLLEKGTGRCCPFPATADRLWLKLEDW